MKNLPKNVGQSGQALLLVLLSMAVVLTVVLSILSRSITDVSVSTKEEEALRAFSAAEAGVEEALISGNIGSIIANSEYSDNASFSTSIAVANTNDYEFGNPIGIFSGESITFWFVAHDDDGDLICSAERPCFTGNQIKICWGKEGTAGNTDTTPAIEASVYYLNTPGSIGTARIARAAIDPNETRRASNGFSAPDSGTCDLSTGERYAFQKTFDLSTMNIGSGVYSTQNGLQFIKIKMLYNTTETHTAGISTNYSGNGTLPSQGVKITSTGISGASNRKIDVFQGYGELPSVFDSAIFSLGGITK